MKGTLKRDGKLPLNGPCAILTVCPINELSLIPRPRPLPAPPPPPPRPLPPPPPPPTDKAQ